MSENIQPNKWKFHSPYVNLDLEHLKDNICQILLHKGTYFQRPLDTVWWEITTGDGKLSDQQGIVEIEEIFDRCHGLAQNFSISLYHDEILPNSGWKKPAIYYLMFSIDFIRETFTLEISTIGQENAESLFQIVTDGITLLNIELPSEHSYLQTHVQRFARDHPDGQKNVFLIMRFKEHQAFRDIGAAVRDTCGRYGLNVLRADDREYTDDLWDNVMTYMYGCSAAIAVFDQINGKTGGRS